MSIIKDEHRFEVAGQPAFIIPADSPASAPAPWVWYAPTFLANSACPTERHTWIFSRLQQAGVAIAGMDIGESYGSPDGRRLYSAFYDELTGNRGMSPKPCLMPQSRGGLMLYNWAAENAESVGCIAGIYAVCDIRSYPGIDGASEAYQMPAGDLAGCLYEHNPVDRLGPLAAANVPIFNVHGDNDEIVPLMDNSGEVDRRYYELGGSTELLVIPGKGHEEVDEFFCCQPLVDFILKHIAQ